MKFKFRMQKVLEHRKTLEDIAKSDFEKSQQVLNSEIEKLQKMIDDKRHSRVVAYDTQISDKSTGAEKKFILTQAEDFQKLQDIRIERQKQAVQIAEKEVEAKREILKNKAIDYKIIDKFKENKKEQFKEEVKKKEQSEVDEIVTLRYAAGNKK